ncbi:MAG: hypothetical protein ACLPJJ_07355 [Acidocella sp.]|uniref:hypothetical protein n=1 Tax=Acidocella sp. TaxID=50710 RepID=UPI003FD8C184
MANSPPLSPEDRRALFAQVMQCLEKEDNLIHYRMTWGLQWNIACFAALFAVLFAAKNAYISVNRIPFFEIALAFVGIVVSVLSLIGILSVHKQTTFLIVELTKRLGIKNHDWEDSEFIRPYGDPSTVHRNARRVSAFLPILFVILWISVFLFAYPSMITPGH